MKSPVKYSTYASIATLLTIAVLIFVVIMPLHRGQTGLGIVFAACTAVLLLSALWYAPLSISLQDGMLSVHRSLRIKSIPVADIASVRLCPPTMAAVRVCGSGGFLGYWGWFRERDLGRYFAYYGRSSDCFLVALRDGRLYMLGCADAPAMVQAIEQAIKKQKPA